MLHDVAVCATIVSGGWVACVESTHDVTDRGEIRGTGKPIYSVSVQVGFWRDRLAFFTGLPVRR